MSKKWRTAIVGVGVVGEWHLRIASMLPEMQLVALCDTDQARAKAALEKNKLPSVPIHGDLSTMLKSEKPDLVQICTPSGDHMHPTITALNAGVNVICEKPLEIQLDRIDKMIELSKKHKVRLAGVFQNRWNESNKAMKAAMDEGRFGTLAFAGCYTQWYRTDDYYRDGGWRGTWKWDGGGAVMNQSVHAIDLLQWIVGPVKSVSAYAASRIHPEIEVEDTLAASLQFENGAFGCIVGTTAMYPGAPARIEVGGSNGSAVSEGFLKTFKFREERESDKELLERVKPLKESTAGGSNPRDVRLELHTANITSILEAWEAGRDAETNGPEARKAVAIVLAMYESAKNGGNAVKVE